MNIIVQSLAIIAISAIIPTALVLIYYSPSDLQFCTARSCVEFASEYFDIPIKTFIGCLSFLSITSAVYNIQINSKLLKQNFLSSWCSNSVIHRNEFSKLVKWEAEKTEALTEKSFNPSVMHSKLFPSLSILGTPAKLELNNFNISKEAELELKSLANYISETDRNYGDPHHPFSMTAHKKTLRAKLASMGILIDDLPNKHHFDIEKEIFKFINRLSQQLGIEEIKIPEEPSYHAH